MSFKLPFRSDSLFAGGFEKVALRHIIELELRDCQSVRILVFSNLGSMFGHMYVFYDFTILVTAFDLKY